MASPRWACTKTLVSPQSPAAPLIGGLADAAPFGVAELVTQPPAGEACGPQSEGLAPAPAIELDPVAAALWRTELAETGLPFAVRCLATWWRVERHCPPHPPAAIAAAIASAVAKAAGLRRSRAQASSLYASEPGHAERAASDLGVHLKLDRRWGW